MAEDDPRHGEAPEHGHDPGTPDQPGHPPAEPEPEPPTVAGPPRETSSAGDSGPPEDGTAGSAEPTQEPGEPPSHEPPPGEPGEPPSSEPQSSEPGQPFEPEPGRPSATGLGETAETQRLHLPDDATVIRPTGPWAQGAPPDEPGRGPRPVGPGGTTVMPAVPPAPGAGPTAPVGTPRWSARAQVPQAPAPSDDTMADGMYEQPHRRAWAMPALIGVCVVLLLAAIGFGAWLVVRGLQGTTPSPSVGPTQPTATAPPTTAPTKPSPTATTKSPVAVPVPDLRGQDYAAAANTLTGLGLVPKRVNEPSATVPAGKVIRTDPSGGFVLSGDDITVVVSSGSPTPSPSPSPSASPKKT
jgi:hypothetical protein